MFFFCCSFLLLGRLRRRRSALGSTPLELVASFGLAAHNVKHNAEKNKIFLSHLFLELIPVCLLFLFVLVSLVAVARLALVALVVVLVFKVRLVAAFKNKANESI